MRFNELLHSELARRRQISPGYSLRGFARFLGMHHSALSRLMRHGGGVPERSIRRLGVRLGLDVELVNALCASEQRLMIVAAVRRTDFRPSSRWIASATGIPLDGVNVSLQFMIASGQLCLLSRQQWQVREEESA